MNQGVTRKSKQPLISGLAGACPLPAALRPARPRPAPHGPAPPRPAEPRTVSASHGVCLVLSQQWADSTWSGGNTCSRTGTWQVLGTGQSSVTYRGSSRDESRVVRELRSRRAEPSRHSMWPRWQQNDTHKTVSLNQRKKFERAL